MKERSVFREQKIFPSKWMIVRVTIYSSVPGTVPVYTCWPSFIINSPCSLSDNFS